MANAKPASGVTKVNPESTPTKQSEPKETKLASGVVRKDN